MTSAPSSCSTPPAPQRLDQHRWTEAVDYFQEVERQHPYSEWSRRSILMQAYAYYQGNDYDEAIADADRFIQLYPGNPSAAYAYYLKAICYFEQIIDVGRDQGATETGAGRPCATWSAAIPTSDYATDARLKIDMVNDQLAGKEMTIGRYYLRDGQPLAADRPLQDGHRPATRPPRHTPEALYRLVEAYLTLGPDRGGQAQRRRARLQLPGRPLVRRRLHAADASAAASRWSAVRVCRFGRQPPPPAARGRRWTAPRTPRRRRARSGAAPPKKKSWWRRLIPG